MINPGELRYQVDLYSLITVIDNYGYTSNVYTYQSTFKCKVVKGGGTNGITNEELFTSSNIQFTTYYRTILLTDRIRFNGQDYVINNIKEIDFRSGLILECELLQGVSDIGVLSGTTVVIGGQSGTSGISGTSGTSGNNGSYLLENRTIRVANESGRSGSMCYDDANLYVCIDTDTWKRIKLETWSEI